MGGHGHGHHEPYHVPKASIYKIEDAPEIMQLQQELAKRGLKDPWARNEVWRFNVKQFGTHASRARTFFLRGLPLGAALTVATIGLEMAFADKDDHHGHNGDHH